MKSLFGVYRLIFAFLLAIVKVGASQWPVVKPIHEQYTFVRPGMNDTDIPILLFIKNLEGIPTYKLECHNGNYEESSEINFSGDLQCAVFGVRGEQRTTWNLLADSTEAEQHSDWLNRGRMTSDQLWGTCGLDPNSGMIRVFRLRGMRITLMFSNVKWVRGVSADLHQLEEFTFTISVVSDRRAVSKVAETVKSSISDKSCN